MTCWNGGIYVYDGACMDQYTGKTTVPYGTRTTEHVRRQKTSSVYKHREKCRQCTEGSFKISFVEDYRKRGKYTLSEREYLWNSRIKGVINDQKTLLNWTLFLDSCFYFWMSCVFCIYLSNYFSPYCLEICADDSVLLKHVRKLKRWRTIQFIKMLSTSRYIQGDPKTAPPILSRNLETPCKTEHNPL